MSCSVAGFARDSQFSYLTAIRGPRDVESACKSLPRAQREVFAVLLLIARDEMVRRVTVNVGSLHASIVHPEGSWSQPPSPQSRRLCLCTIT